MIKVRHIGSFKKLESAIDTKDTVKKQIEILHKYGKIGVERLQLFTPIDTGKTAMSWNYRVDVTNGRATLTWTNDNMTKMNIPVAILIQCGHGTQQGYFVQGIDYINPALKPVFDNIAKDAWEEVNS